MGAVKPYDYVTGDNAYINVNFLNPQYLDRITNILKSENQWQIVVVNWTNLSVVKVVQRNWDAIDEEARRYYGEYGFAEPEAPNQYSDRVYFSKGYDTTNGQGICCTGSLHEGSRSLNKRIKATP